MTRSDAELKTQCVKCCKILSRPSVFFFLICYVFFNYSLFIWAGGPWNFFNPLYILYYEGRLQ